MIYRFDLNKDSSMKIRPRRLGDFNLDERGFQKLLFGHLNNLLPDDELMIIAQSIRGNEEPDIFALDKNGRLFIFELKIWESRCENVLQVLRYGQIFGQKEYTYLQSLFHRDNKIPLDLKTAHQNKFDLIKPLHEDEFNCEQVFVVMTNGIDIKTREAISYWSKQGLNIQSWVYRIYGEPDLGQLDFEIVPYRASSDPYEDISDGFFFLNTNIKNDPSGVDERTMLEEKVAAAYFGHWKEKIKNLTKGDTVFLYKSGVGVIAMGEISSGLKIRDYQGKDEYKNEEYYKELKNFKELDSPITAEQIGKLLEHRICYMQTLFSLSYEDGCKLKEFINSNKV